MTAPKKTILPPPKMPKKAPPEWALLTPSDRDAACAIMASMARIALSEGQPVVMSGTMRTFGGTVTAANSGRVAAERRARLLEAVAALTRSCR